MALRFLNITSAKLRVLRNAWETTFNKFRGPIPLGYALCHMATESGGIDVPNFRGKGHNAIGIMQLPQSVVNQFSYSRDELLEPTKNIYVWCSKINNDGQYLKDTFPTFWEKANKDYWLATRLMFILGQKNTTNLIKAVQAHNSSASTTADILAWIIGSMGTAKSFGGFNLRHMFAIVKNIQSIDDFSTLIDGKNKESYAFYDSVPLSPGARINVLR